MKLGTKNLIIGLAISSIALGLIVLLSVLLSHAPTVISVVILLLSFVTGLTAFCIYRGEHNIDYVKCKQCTSAASCELYQKYLAGETKKHHGQEEKTQ